MVAPGDVIGRKYRLEYPLGQGGMGTVWRARHLTLDQPVALKLLDVRGPRAEEAIARFLREAKAAAAVRHRNVVYVTDFGTTSDKEPYMVMELLEGQSLADRLLHGPRLRLTQFSEIAVGILGGLGAVHAAGIVHRDLKPHNVFLVRDADGEFPKLLDFGLSRPNESSGTQASALTREGVILGTPEYMAPEQARLRRDLDARADIYSMGTILYEALCGERPFVANNPADLLHAMLSEDVPPLAVVRPELGRPFSELVARALRRDREERFSSAREMREALENALARTPNSGEILLPETFESRGLQHTLEGVPSDVQTRAYGDLPASSHTSESVPTLPRHAWPVRSVLTIAVLTGVLALLFAARQMESTAIPARKHKALEAAKGDSVVARGPTPNAVPDAIDEAQMVTVELVGAPEDAQAYVDGIPVPGTTMSLPKDGAVHELEVRAPGLEPWHMEHLADADGQYLIDMRRIERPGREQKVSRSRHHRHASQDRRNLVRIPDF